MLKSGCLKRELSLKKRAFVYKNVIEVEINFRGVFEVGHWLEKMRYKGNNIADVRN